MHPDLLALQSLMVRLQRDHALLDRIKGTPRALRAYLKAEREDQRHEARMRLRGRR